MNFIFLPKLGQIAPKWDKSGTFQNRFQDILSWDFSYQISVHFWLTEHMAQLLSSLDQGSFEKSNLISYSAKTISPNLKS